MRRRSFLSFLAGGIACLPASRAVGANLPRVGIATFDPELSSAVVDGLKQLGWSPGRDIEIVYSGSDAPFEALDKLLAANLSLLIAPGAVRIRYAKDRTSIPIVGIDLESDPIESGFADSLARPNGAITGIWLDMPELAGKIVGFAREIVPDLKRVSILFDDRVGQPQHRVVKLAAENSGLRTTSVAIRDPREAVSTLNEKLDSEAQALIVLTSPTLYFVRAEIAKAAAERRIPSVGILTDFARAGGLLAYGPSLRDMFKRSASYVDRILRGQSPATIPIERPVVFELVVNRVTAAALGVSLPSSVVSLADEVIE